MAGACRRGVALATHTHRGCKRVTNLRLDTGRVQTCASGMAGAAGRTSWCVAQARWLGNSIWASKYKIVGGSALALILMPCFAFTTHFCTPIERYACCTHNVNTAHTSTPHTFHTVHTFHRCARRRSPKSCLLMTQILRHASSGSSATAHTAPGRSALWASASEATSLTAAP